MICSMMLAFRYLIGRSSNDFFMRHPYTEFRYIYPPRPSGAIHHDHVTLYPGWIAQYKYNGTRNIVAVFPDGHIEMFNRHREHNKAYRPTPDMISSFKALKLPLGSFHVFDCELMHSKTRGLKDRVILFDILVSCGDYLIGSRYIDRYRALEKLLGTPTEFESETNNKIAYRVNNNIWFSKIYTKDLPERFRKLIHMDEVEGLVLKDPNGKLTFGLQEENNGSWMIRVRKPNKNYAY